MQRGPNRRARSWRRAPFGAAPLALALLTASGCATVTRGISESFVIETVPAGAEATLSTGQSCTTPCSIKVKRRGEFTVMLEKDGYETLKSIVTSSVDGTGTAAGAGNLVLGGPSPIGLIGAGVDLGTGAMHAHEPNPLRVQLVRLPTNNE